MRTKAFCATVLALAAVGNVAGQVPAWSPLTPFNGKAGSGLEPFDELVVAMITRYGIPGASLAIAKDGRLLLAKGYGYADREEGVVVRPETRFLLASCSKPITAAAILKLLQEGKLKLDDPILDLLPHLRPPQGGKVDPRLRKATVRQCLHHTGGWDREKSGDPIGWAPQIARALGLKAAPTQREFLSFMMALPLDFEPGADVQYSNVGYIFLAEIVETISGQPYESYVRKEVFGPMGITQARQQGGTQYLPGEAKRYLPGMASVLPPQQLPMTQGSGGWSMSTVDLVRFLTALDGSRGKAFLDAKTFPLMTEMPAAPAKARTDGTFSGLGFFVASKKESQFTYMQEGLWHGTRTVMKRSPQGVNWALAFNSNMQPDILDGKAIRETVRVVRERIEGHDRFPDLDLFKEFP